MNSRNLKSNKKNKISAKTYIFWGAVMTAVLVLIIFFIVSAVQRKDIRSFESLDYVEREGIFNQQESEYYVLFYDYAGPEEICENEKSYTGLYLKKVLEK